MKRPAPCASTRSRLRSRPFPAAARRAARAPHGRASPSARHIPGPRGDREWLDLARQQHAAGHRSRGPASPDAPRDIGRARRCSRRRCRGSETRRRRERRSMPVNAPQSSTAEAISVSKTACRSNAERLMTFSTSAVAVCCCSASERSLRARLHLVEQADVLDRDHRLIGEGLHEFDLARSVNGPALARSSAEARRSTLGPRASAARPERARTSPTVADLAYMNSGSARDVRNMHHLARQQHAADGDPRPGAAGWPARNSTVLRGSESAAAMRRRRRREADRSRCRAAELTAEAIRVCKTACRSNAERLITFSTSAVAVCCCSASARSRVLRLHLLEQPRVLDRDHRLIGEGLQQIELTLGEFRMRLPRDDDRADRLPFPDHASDEVREVADHLCDLAQARGAPDCRGSPQEKLRSVSAETSPPTA